MYDSSAGKGDTGECVIDEFRELRVDHWQGADVEEDTLPEKMAMKILQKSFKPMNR